MRPFLLKLFLMSKGKHLLVVDDEPDLREIIADEFRFDGAEVFEAANGVDGLDLYLKHKPDIVITDIRMPGGDGITLAKTIKEMDPAKSRVFLISGFADLFSADAFEFGVEGFFTKPFHLDEIRASVNRALLPSNIRWQTMTGISAEPTAEIILLSLDWRKDFRNQVFPVGRGGFFLPLNLMIPHAVPLHVGDVVSVKASNESLGFCAIRWIRGESKDRTLGMGLEFLHLNPEFMNLILGLEKVHEKIAYIPSKLTS